ncbi:MAG: alpha/beta fold hydrolase [Verrucomicrobia bacterium]|nr:alpha/beta fold hydrolase [Verrucomicrobiota bacterium]
MSDVRAAAPEPSEHPVSPGLRWLCGCVLVVLLAGFLASRVQTSGGAVQVVGLKIPTQNGQWLVADLFRPRTATAEKPAPLVVVVPGFQRSKETQANLSIELARRGVVVIAIDPYAQGGSSSSTSPRSATEEGYGAFAVIEYAASTGVLNYVDKARLGVTGHSAGGNAALQAASTFGREAQQSGRPSKVHSAFVSGYVLTLTERTLRTVRSNVGISYALHDEGAYRNELKHGDLRRAPEALRLVQSGLGREGAGLQEVEMDRWYGDLAARTARVVHNEPLLHPFQPYSTVAMANQLAFFIKVFGLADVPPPGDQVWYWKELLCLVALVAAFLAIVPLARVLLAGVPYFGALVHPVPPAQPRPQGVGRLVYWTLFVLGALIACFTYIPMAELSQKLFVAASGREQTWFFPQRMNNAVMLWAVLNSLVGYALFFLTYRFFGRHRGVRPEMWGAATTGRELWRSFLLAVAIWLGFFLLLAGVYYFFHVDYRVLFFGARVFQPPVLILLLMYAPMFFLFFLSNSLRVNGAMRLEGESEGRGMLLGGLANSLGLLFIVVVQYATFAATGTVHWTDGWLYINLLFAVVPIMFVLPYYHRLFFRLTGRIYAGPMTTGLIFITILLSNTVCYVPV